MSEGDQHLRIAVMTVSIRSDGGAEVLIRTLIDELDGRPYDIELFTMRELRSEVVHSLDSIHKVDIRTFPAHRLVSPRRFVKLFRALRDGHYDVIHTNLPAMNILGTLCGRLLGVPVVATLHNSETSADAHWYQGKLETFLLRRYTTRIVAVGDRTAASRRARLAPREVHVLHNAVAPSEPLSEVERSALRSTIMTDPTSKLLLSVGRLTDQKAHDDLIRAMVEVRCRRPSVELAVAGRGDRLGELTALADELGCSDSVHLLGSRQDVRSLMRAADALVISSLWEGLPIVLLEAMEAGLPVVSTDVGDIGPLVREEFGRLVSPGDPHSLADAIVQLLGDLDEGRLDLSVPRSLIADQHSSAAWAEEMVTHWRAAIAAGR